MNFKKPSYGVVIFSKDEENSVSLLIDEIKKIVPENDIFLVDGHSSDRTVPIAINKKIQVILDLKRGKGCAIRQAINCIERDILVLMDADGSHRPQEIPLLLRPLFEDKTVDLVIASRFKGKSDELNNSIFEIMRLLGNLLSTAAIRLRFGCPVTDVQNGFRAIRRDSMRSLKLKEDGFAIEQEMVMKCLRNKKNIVEIPSWELKRKFNRSHIRPLSMLPRYIASLLKNIF